MISIIIPTYNEEKCLPLLLESIKSQVFTDYEIIIADNNSSDGTRHIAQHYGARIVSGGLPAAGRNSGAFHAKGDILLFLDADVILYNRYFLKSIDYKFCIEEFDIATCQVHPLSERWDDLFLHQAYNLFVRATASFSPFAPGFCLIVKKEVHDTINGFDISIKLGEDSDYVRRAAKKYKFGVLKNKIPVSVRRLDRDGRLNVAIKYILCGLHIGLLGKVKSDIFNYTFGHKS